MSLLRRLGVLRGWGQRCAAPALEALAARGVAAAPCAGPLFALPPRAAPPLWGALGLSRGFAACAFAARPLAPPAGARGFAIKAKPKPLPKGGKMKLPSSFKERFKVTGTGNFMRMRVGKRHCAFAKSRPQRRRLRKKALVAPGRAVIMRKLGYKYKGSGR